MKTSSFSIAVLSDNSVHTTTVINDKIFIKKRERVSTVWDMSKIDVPKQRFRLSPKQHFLYTIALFSDAGKEVIQRMKNERGNHIINSFLHVCKEGIPQKPKNSLLNFVEEIIDEPLVGDNQLRTISIGITKKEIFEEFVKQGIITLNK